MDKIAIFFTLYSIVLIAISFVGLWYEFVNRKIEIVFSVRDGEEFKFQCSPNDPEAAEKLIEYWLEVRSKNK
jgi:hypothetical protein